MNTIPRRRFLQGMAALGAASPAMRLAFAARDAGTLAEEAPANEQI
jgi:hypothetical protein